MYLRKCLRQSPSISSLSMMFSDCNEEDDDDWWQREWSKSLTSLSVRLQLINVKLVNDSNIDDFGTFIQFRLRLMLNDLLPVQSWSMLHNDLDDD